MLRGLALVNFWATDVEAAGRWYADLLGIDPYFRRPEEGSPAYLEFRIGDFQHEFGVVDRRVAPSGAGGSPAGAEEYEAPTDRGGGFVTASVVDPFGNILGVMRNPHYLEVLGSTGRARAAPSPLPRSARIGWASGG